ncbi:response regulator [Pantoea trifolii]|uniref:response regulator transcription factor n=1 Tax=Pantoea trifolii TaxID=2968030 RepID=UPI003ED93F6C
MNFEDNNVINIVVVDDHPLIREALKNSIQHHASLSLVALCKNREELMQYLPHHTVDLLVLDYVLGGKDTVDGLQLIKQLRARYPKLKILMYSAIESPALVQMVLKNGVRGYISKTKDVDELIEAILNVAGGKRVVSNDMQYELDKFRESEKSMEEYVLPRSEDASKDIEMLIKELTPRENEVIYCYLNGMTINDIAIKFNRSRKTVSGHKQAALRKMGMSTDLDLFRFKEFWLEK